MDCAEFRSSYEAELASRFREPNLSTAVDHMHACVACGDWYMEQEVRTGGGEPTAHPCVHVAYYSLDTCPTHRGDPYSCPDVLLVQDRRTGVYELPIRDGGRTPKVVAIQFCPWCGTSLAKRVAPAR
jgi:uncharacterized protein DUF6980